MTFQAMQRYEAWRALVDFSTQLALAGLKAQGLSQRQAQAVWRQRWARAVQEHQRANRRLIRRLAARDPESKRCHSRPSKPPYRLGVSNRLRQLHPRRS